MNKEQAIKEMVKEFQAIPEDWIQIIMEAKDECHTLPMWGTMFIIDDSWGERLLRNTRRMVGSIDEVDAREGSTEEERDRIEKAKEEKDWDILQHYINEDMEGELCVLDRDGTTTNMFLYEIDDHYVLGIHGAGFDFYDGVWDRLYDILELKWHEEE